MAESINDRIRSVIDRSRIVVFMKGNPRMPMCGFSAAVVQVLEDIGVPYESVDVLQDQAIREGIKGFSNWPTIPQLYVDRQFIGGCDIVREMHARGELAALIHGRGSEGR
jgi:monothiol glutaredoxin